MESITNAPEIQELFIKHPKLRTQMRSIYQAFLQGYHPEQPSSYHSISGGHVRHDYRGPGHVHNQHQSPEKGYDNGLKRLQWHIDIMNTDSIGLREFCKTITKLRLMDLESHSLARNNHV